MQNLSLCADAYPQPGLAEHNLQNYPSFQDLYWRLKPFVSQAAHKYHGLNKRLDVDDLKQIGLITLWKAHQSYKPVQGVPIEHYARRAVVNEILKECQRGQRKQEMLYHDCVFGSDDGTDLADASIIDLLDCAEDEMFDPVFQVYAGQEVSAALHGPNVDLTDSQRQILDLLYRQGLNTQEVAALLNVSHQNISQQHRKALQICRAYLGVTVH